MKKSSTLPQLHPFTSSLQRAAYFFEHNFTQLLFAIAFPTVISLLIFWTGIGVTIVQLSNITSIQELGRLFSWASPTTYMLFLMVLVLFCLNTVGLIAGPLVMVHHDHIKITEILPKSMKYFFPYLRLGILIILTLALMYVVAYLFIVIISSIAGFINMDYLDPTFNILAAAIPNIGLVGIAICYMFAPFVLIEQNVGAYEAVTTSVTLVRRHFWHIVLRLFMVISGVLLVSFLLLFIPYVGYALSLFISALVTTVYNYVLYEDVTEVTWP